MVSCVFSYLFARTEGTYFRGVLPLSSEKLGHVSRGCSFIKIVLKNGKLGYPDTIHIFPVLWGRSQFTRSTHQVWPPVFLHEFMSVFRLHVLVFVVVWCAFFKLWLFSCTLSTEISYAWPWYITVYHSIFNWFYFLLERIDIVSSSLLCQCLLEECP